MNRVTLCPEMFVHKEEWLHKITRKELSMIYKDSNIAKPYGEFY